MAPDGDPHPVDRHVGLRIRELRRGLGVSQEALAAAIGVTFQQLQKYEKGANRISASKLFGVAAALDVDVDHLFDGLARPPSPLLAVPQAERRFAPLSAMTAEAQQLDGLLVGLSLPRRKLVVQLARGLAGSPESEPAEA